MKELHIGYHFADPQAHGSPAAVWARTSLLLAELPSQLVFLHLVVYVPRDLMVPRGSGGELVSERVIGGIEVLDTVLERPNYKDLRTLSFTLQSTASRDDITEAQYRERLNQKLSKLHARRPRAIDISFR